jgi:hypothetical protein
MKHGETIEGHTRAKSRASNIFVGDQGLRSGWSVLLFVGLAIGLCFGSLALVRSIAHLHRSQTAIAPLPHTIAPFSL